MGKNHREIEFLKYHFPGIIIYLRLKAMFLCHIRKFSLAETRSWVSRMSLCVSLLLFFFVLFYFVGFFFCLFFPELLLQPFTLWNLKSCESETEICMKAYCRIKEEDNRIIVKSYLYIINVILILTNLSQYPIRYFTK